MFNKYLLPFKSEYFLRISELIALSLWFVSFAMQKTNMRRMVNWKINHFN